jgi:polar amino acid transport system substrate-binding protein
MGKRSVALAGLIYGWWGVQQLAAPPVAFAADIKTIKERGYLIVAVKDNTRPLGFRNSQGELQGLEIDIARRLAETILGKPDAVKFVPVSNADRLTFVTEDKVDLAIAHLTATQARARLVYFSPPYYFNGTSFITKQSPIEKPSQFKTVAVLEGSHTIATLQYALPKLKLVGVDSYQAAQAKLDSGEVEAFAANTTTLTGWLQDNPNYRLIPAQLNREPLSVAFPKGLQYEDLGKVVNQSLRQWQQDGWLKERATYWGLPWDSLGKR